MGEHTTANGNVTPPSVERLALELREVAQTGFGLELLHYAKRFLEYQNPNWIDLLVWRITEEKFALPQTVQIWAADVAKQRLQGVGSRNNMSKVLKEHLKEVQFALMASFVGLGDTRAKAAARAANTVHSIWGHSNKASVLEKEFSDYMEHDPVGMALSKHLATAAEQAPENHKNLESELSKLNQRGVGSRR